MTASFILKGQRTLQYGSRFGKIILIRSFFELLKMTNCISLYGINFFKSLNALHDRAAIGSPILALSMEGIKLFEEFVFRLLTSYWISMILPTFCSICKHIARSPRRFAWSEKRLKINLNVLFEMRKVFKIQITVSKWACFAGVLRSPRDCTALHWIWFPVNFNRRCSTLEKLS